MRNMGHKIPKVHRKVKKWPLKSKLDIYCPLPYSRFSLLQAQPWKFPFTQFISGVEEEMDNCKSLESVCIYSAYISCYILNRGLSEFSGAIISIFMNVTIKTWNLEACDNPQSWLADFSFTVWFLELPKDDLCASLR